ncbi:MAG: hypothetical protein KGH64_00675 [Candidatus Micrarchaeota archaeon]|nr:hypothetical protein [Candidatus Micrarchaeota archaeon]
MKHLNYAVFGYRFSASRVLTTDKWGVVDERKLGYGSVVVITEDAYCAKGLAQEEAFALAEKLAAEAE